MMKQKKQKIKMATAKKNKKQVPEFFQIIKMNKFQSKVLRAVARLVGLGGEEIFVITLSIAVNDKDK